MSETDTSNARAVAFEPPGRSREEPGLAPFVRVDVAGVDQVAIRVDRREAVVLEHLVLPFDLRRRAGKGQTRD